MNKIERMKAVFANQAPDYTPAGFWFHYPADWGAEETAEAHLKTVNAVTELNGAVFTFDRQGRRVTKVEILRKTVE